MNKKTIFFGIGIGLILFLVLMAVIFIADESTKEVYVIPSASMEPTLKMQSSVEVDKSKEAINNVQTGDIIIFKAPEEITNDDPKIKEIVKRIVGMPGDTVEGRCEDFEYSCNVKIYINDELYKENYISKDDYAPFEEIEVQEGEVLTLGDNRAYSKDGRYYGPIPIDSIIGVVQK